MILSTLLGGLLNGKVKNKTLLSLSHAKCTKDAEFQCQLRYRWSSRWLRATERRGIPNGKLPLIHSHIINLVTHGHGREVYLATGAAHGKVQEQVHGGVEGVVAMAVLAVDGLAEVYLVEQFVVQIDAYVVLVPIHARGVELCCYGYRQCSAIR